MPLPSEALVRMFANQDLLSSMLCTPSDLTELATGWLFSQGFIESIDAVVAVDTVSVLQTRRRRTQ